jgi:hypothetical protein
MPIDLEFVFDGVGVVYHCAGSLTAQHFMDANARLLASPERIAKLRFAVIDLTDMVPVYIAPSEMEHIVLQDRQMASFLRSSLTVALISPHNLGFGLARMWEAFAGGLEWETMTFRSRDEAETWIRTRLKNKFNLELPLRDAAAPQE